MENYGIFTKDFLLVFSEVYYWAGISAEDFQKELEYQLRKTTLGISVGMVKEPTSENGVTVFDPYMHFGGKASLAIQPKANHLDYDDAKRSGKSIGNHQANGEVFKYKVCEIRPPSIEKFLDFTTSSLDVSAPAVTFPGKSFKAPFDSRNTAFGKDAFMALLLLPESDQELVRYDVEEPDAVVELYFLRSIIAHRILREIDCSTKFSISRAQHLR